MNPQRRQFIMALAGVLLLSTLAALITSVALLSERPTEPVILPTVALLPSPLPFDTPTRGPTATPTLTVTPIPSITPSATPSSTITITPTPTNTFTPTNTSTPTATFTFTASPLFVPTATFVFPTTAVPLLPTDAPPLPAATDVPPPPPGATAVIPPTALPPPTDVPPPVTAVAAAPPLPPPVSGGPTLDDFWHGRAYWTVDEFNVGLPLGESDTIIRSGDVLWSYLHASSRSAGIIDQCGAPVEFPGCVTLWASADGGRSFQLTSNQCLLPCQRCPCDPENDHPQQQQYPRVATAYDGTMYMVYEVGAQTMLRTSTNGGTGWSFAEPVPGTGIWPLWFRTCSALERIDPHPFVPSIEWDCLVGAPPGIYVEGDELYVFVDLGSNPAHMGCFRGNRFRGAAGLRRCNTTPLFSGSPSYGPAEARSADANPYFDHRYVSSADVAHENGRYYMVYEGVRGPGPGDAGDTQFGLGIARSSGGAIDMPWEKYPGNPILSDLPGNVGLGHADLINFNGMWYLYTTTADGVRGRYRLAWR